MSGAAHRLGRLVVELSEAGAPAERVVVVQAALNFKRSWIDLAELLVRVRAEGHYRGWGYESFLRYCQQELSLTPATVDKLTVSFSTLRKHAPSFARDDGSQDAPIPSYQSLDYFSRVVGEPRADGSEPRDAPREPPDEQVMERLRTAVFEEGASVHRLRTEFDPLIRPKGEVEQQLEAVRRASSTARRLREQIDLVERLSPERVGAVHKAIESLQLEMEALTALLGEEQEGCAA